MCLVKPEDFAKALNVSYGTIRSKISRKQLLRNKKGFIDTDNPKNYLYVLDINGGDQSVFEEYHQGVISKPKIDKKSNDASKTQTNVKNNLKSVVFDKKVENEKPSKIGASVNIVSTVEIEKKPEKKVVEKISLEEKREKDSQRKANESFLNIEIRKKLADVLVVERTAELKLWELEKKAGSTLPITMIEKVIAINFKAIYKSIKSQHKNIVMVVVQQLGGSKEDLDSILIQLDDVLDGTVKDAEKKSTIDVEKLIDEYSEIRSRGERKV